MRIDRFARKSGIGYQTFGWLGLLVLLVVALLVVLPASAAAGQPVTSGVVTWTGKGGDERWSNPANWDSGRVPGPTD